MHLFWLIQQKATVNRQGFGFWAMNSIGKLSETRAANRPRKLRLGCCTPTVKCCSLHIQACSGTGKMVTSLTRKRELKGNQSDCHRSLKLLFIFPHKLFTFYSYFCVFSLSIYKAQHSESWAKDLDFCAVWIRHLITCLCYLETYFSLNSCGSLAICNAINTCWKALIENFWMQDKVRLKKT